MKEGLTIIVPIYNEEDNLNRIEQELGAYVQNATLNTKVLLVDDGSKDNSLSGIKGICERHSEFSYISFKENCGLSAAIKAGFDAVTTTLTGYIDADLQTTPKDFDKLLEHVGEFELITGVRSQRKDSVLKTISSKTANAIRRAFTKDGMTDTGCPLKIITTEYAKRIPMFKGMHRFLPAMILLQGGLVKEVEVAHFPRVAGVPKFGLWNRLFGPLIDCFAYLWMKRKYIRYTIKEQG